MAWRCADCGRTHDDPPKTCACGSADIQPERGDTDADRFSLLAVRRRLFNPEESDRSLLTDDDRIALAFRVVLVVSLVVLSALAVHLLV